MTPPADPFGLHNVPEVPGVVRDGWKRTGDFWRGPCPCCGSRTGGWFTLGANGRGAAGCWACGDADGVRAALGLAPMGQVWRSPTRWTGRRSSDRALDMVADAEVLDAVYRVLLRHLELDAAGRDHVLRRQRGFSEALRDAVGPLIAPVPTDDAAWRRLRDRVIAELRPVAPYETLIRVPEFSARANRGLAVLHTRREAEYFEPWCDEQGRIVALRAYMGRDAESKYLATGGRWGPMIHLAVGVPRAAISAAAWVFTEGWMKAEAVAHTFGCVAVALPGVASRGAWARALQLKQELAPATPAYIAFDAEVWTTRPDIAVLALDFALAAEHTSGRPAGFAVWDAVVGSDGRPSPKGIDDAVVAGIEIEFTDRHGLGSRLGPAIELWEDGRAAA